MKRASVMLLATLASAACGETSIVRSGPAQQRLVSRTYAVSSTAARAKILDAFERSRPALPEPFLRMTAAPLGPPVFSPDWVMTFIDPGGLLVAYKQMPPEDRLNDVLIQDPTGDLYWVSEYRTANPGKLPVQFHCGFIVHLASRGSAGTEVQVYEVAPAVWVGEHWAFAAHGLGIGRYHDIRFVEPTVTDRVRTLDLIDGLLKD